MTRRAAKSEAPATRAAPQLGRRERKKREKHRRILAAARELFHRKGFEETTTQEIAELADVGFGTLYLYVDSKEDLLVQVFKDEMDSLVVQSFEAVPERATLPRQLESMFGAWIAHHEEDLPLARVLVREMSFPGGQRRRQESDALVRDILERIATLVRRAQERGEVRADAAPEQAARTAFAVYLQLLQSFLGGYVGAASFRRQLRASLELLMAGMSAGGCSTPSSPVRASRPRRRPRLA